MPYKVTAFFVFQATPHSLKKANNVENGFVSHFNSDDYSAI